MKLSLLSPGPMQGTGHYLVKSIMNVSLSTLDLMIRECLQNSLDAGLSSTGEEPVRVDIIVDRCPAHGVNSIFEGFTDELNRRYGSEIEFIAFRDSGTTGLTGPLKKSEVEKEDFGNLRKLIYEFGRNQEGKGKLGAWGIGKTVCFRPGAGLVLYYSRIKLDDGNYQSRLAGLLIESAKAPNALTQAAVPELIDKAGSTGIAWWGEIDEDGYSYPVTDEQEINRIVDLFGIPKYENGETGTCVIVPYINAAELAFHTRKAMALEQLDESDEDGDNEEAVSSLSHEDIRWLINVLIQRWYYPRFRNRGYRYGSSLTSRVRVYGMSYPEPMLAFFAKMQNFYNYGTEILEKGLDNVVLPENVFANMLGKLNGVFADPKEYAGIVVYGKVTKQELQMTPPDNQLSPYRLVGKTRASGESGARKKAILAYCRDGGMIVDYSVSGGWWNSVPQLDDDEYLLVVFHPNGKAELTDVFKKKGYVCLDDYLRGIEGADHNAWKDLDGVTVVKRIDDRIGGAIAKRFDSCEDLNRSEVDTRLQNILGKMFMPPTGYGKKSSVPVNGGRKENGVKNTNNSKKQISIFYEPVFEADGCITIPFSVDFGKKTDRIMIQSKIRSSSGFYDAHKWEEDDGVGSVFPVEIISERCHFQVEGKAPEIIPLISQKNHCYGFNIKGQLTSINGTLCFRCNDSSVSYMFNVDTYKSSERVQEGKE